MNAEKKSNNKKKEEKHIEYQIQSEKSINEKERKK